MNKQTRVVWVASIALSWAAIGVIAQAFNDAFGAIVFLVGTVALVLWRVTPRLRVLLTASSECVDRARRRWRYARAEAAEAFAWPAWLRLLWYVAALLCLVGFVLGLMAPDGLTGQVVLPTAWVFLMVVAAIDLIGLVRTGLRRTSGRAAGLVVASVGTALVAAVALSFARKMLFAWIGEDPSAFPASLILFTAVLVPFGWLAMIAAASVLLLLPMMLASLWQMGDTRRIDQEGSFHAFLVSLRPALICAVPLFLFIHVWRLRTESWPVVRTAGTAVVVALDYWERPVCGGAIGVANRLDDGHYSTVVEGRNFVFRLRTVACADLQRSLPAGKRAVP